MSSSNRSYWGILRQNSQRFARNSWGDITITILGHRVTVELASVKCAVPTARHINYHVGLAMLILTAMNLFTGLFFGTRKKASLHAATEVSWMFQEARYSLGTTVILAPGQRPITISCLLLSMIMVFTAHAFGSVLVMVLSTLIRLTSYSTLTCFPRQWLIQKAHSHLMFWIDIRSITSNRNVVLTTFTARSNGWQIMSLRIKFR
jgi:hypothetical protein